MNQEIYVVVEHLRGKVADISYVMVAAARNLAQATGGKVTGILLGQDVEDLASSLAVEQVLYVNHSALAEFTSEAYKITLEKLIGENQPRAVLFGNTSVGAGVASALSAKLGYPLVSSAIKFATNNGGVNIVSQICGGKIMVESELPETTTLITMIPGGYKSEEGQTSTTPEIVSVPAPVLDALRISLSQYIEPEIEDVDISQEAILVSVGRGIQNEDNIELAEELAELMGGVVCASRPIVDQGWLPTSRMVGKSGKRVKAKLYLAMGISGAPEHVEGITDCETIIAINTDPKAPIFRFSASW